MYLMLVLVMMALLGAQLWCCDGCLGEERIALLKIKDYFGYPNGSFLWPFSFSWGEDADCCSWDWVYCNATTRRVTGLYLLDIRYREAGDWYLNASLFLPFKQLNRLYLVGNGIAGCAENEGFERLSKLANLEFLDLSSNNFNKSILPSLAVLSSLKTLDLSNNRLKGSINIQELNQQLGSLEYLGLGHNEIEGFKSVDAFSNLEMLGLSGNDINEFVASRGLSNLSVLYLNNITIYGRSVQLLQQSLQAFPNLKTLHLEDNNFKETIFGEGLHNLSCSVEELFLDGSSLDGNVIQSLAKIPSLKNLFMRFLNGTLPSQGLPNLLNLESLDLSYFAVHNNFLQIIGRIPSLKTLILNTCRLNGTIPTVEGLCELKHLQVLDVSYNDLSGTLPPCLANLTSLQHLYLSDNDFSGHISLSPLRSLTSIQELRLSGNQFKIPISLSPFFNHSTLKSLDCSGNYIFVDEEEVSNLAPNFQLEFLDLNGHGYGGAFPKFLYHQHNLQSVDLSNIKMEGVLFPNWLLENNTNLRYLTLANNSLSGFFRLPAHSHLRLASLDISHNYLHGHFPTEIAAYFPFLTSLSLSGNVFNGSIPTSFCSSLDTLIHANNSLLGQIFTDNIESNPLTRLHLDGNQFDGSIPDSIFNCSSLTMLDVSKNSLSGKIPEWMGNISSLEFLDVSQNNFSGSLPSSFNSSQLQYIYLSRNKLQGTMTGAFDGCSQLLALDLSHNYLIGSIPEWIGNLAQLKILLLSYNNLEGKIPIQLCKLNQLSVIDLSNNNLSGHILPCLLSSGDDANYGMAAGPC